jgi:hypothetical protein
MSFSLAERRSKQHQIMGNVVNRGAQGLQDRLVAETKKVAATIKAAVVLTPPAGAKRSREGQGEGPCGRPIVTRGTFA